MIKKILLFAQILLLMLCVGCEKKMVAISEKTVDIMDGAANECRLPDKHIAKGVVNDVKVLLTLETCPTPAHEKSCVSLEWYLGYSSSYKSKDFDSRKEAVFYYDNLVKKYNLKVEEKESSFISLRNEPNEGDER